MRWQPKRNLLWLIALSVTLYGFVQFVLPMFYEQQRQDSYRQTFLSTSLKTCKEIRVANLTTHAIPIARGGDLAADRIDAFCNCITDGDSNSITKEEWQYLRGHRDMMPETSAKRETTFQKCLADAR